MKVLRRASTGRQRQQRRGAITIFVLTCLVLILLICGALLRIGWAERQQVRAQERRLQAEWLVESGLARAAAKLAVQNDYSGETWHVSADELGARDPAHVRIRVERTEHGSRKRRVDVQADYPRDVDSRARLSKQVILEMAPEESKGEKP